MNEQVLLEVVSFKERIQKSNNYVTIALLILIAFFFLLEEIWGGSAYSPTLVRMGANSKDLVHQGEYWRLLTSVFLHGGYLHVFFNGYALVVLGMFVNRIFGNWQFLNLFILSGLIGSVVSLGIGQATLSVGASGALWGLFGASAALSVLPSRLLPEIVRLRI
ncbi:MAG: rhomboid family intramembrane serine protease, partial [bacterium]|nr:rhomboid family intramembrane serine protease [bacterium]